MSARARSGDILALCGGIGGAKLALGLYRVLEAGRLTVVVNTGDDFEHFGLKISPDLDTVLYTLGGVADPVRGWGRARETWAFMAALRQMASETWFQLGDRDLATHVLRTEWLHAGKSLTEFTAHAARQFGISARILPMTDAAVRTIVDTDEGSLPFQHYFVRRRCEPAVRGIRFEGTTGARPALGLVELIGSQALRAIVICPSNPYLSVDPILAVPGIAVALGASAAPVVAVSPIIGGQAVKGPTGKIMAELGIVATTQAIAAHYRGLIDGLVIDENDADEQGQVDVPVMVTRTLMKDIEDRERLAHDVVDFADTIALRPSAKVGGRRPPMSEETRVWAIVPVKRFSTAKSRLASVLAPVERAELARLMFEDVLGALALCKEYLAGQIVVTSDDCAAALASSRGAMVVSDMADNGINAAVRLAITRVDRSHDDGVIIVPSDIPQLSLDGIVKAVNAIAALHTLAVVPATEDGGTNLLACRPADGVPLHFGPHSFDQHCRAALRAGITPRVLALPELGLDIDRPENLRAFLSLKSQTRTHAFLSAIHIAKRLEQRSYRSTQQLGRAAAGA